jgi:hypothetical protein
MRYTAFSSVCLLALLAVPAQAGLAQAGQLFPPQNIGANANVKCPSGQVLTWNKDHVDCVDPTAGVTFACPSGQVLTSIVNGQPVCLTLASGGGVTGGCRYSYRCNWDGTFLTMGKCKLSTDKNWGSGCKSLSGLVTDSGHLNGGDLNNSNFSTCDSFAAAQGYSCGDHDIGNSVDSKGGAGICDCVRK